MAEVHIIGELIGACDFPDSRLFCKFGVSAGSAWRCLEGLQSGQTQLDVPQDGEMAKWGHPIDIHYATNGIQGWPKIHFEVWHQGTLGVNELYGYGFTHIPTSPGTHEISCVCWKPSGSLSDQATSFFVGGGPQLKSSDLVVSPTDRYRLRTMATGKVVLRLGVILRNFEKYGIEM